MEKEKKFTIPEIELIRFINEDIITTSTEIGETDDENLPPFPFNGN